MRLDPNCPIDVYHIEFMRDDRGHARAYLYARSPMGTSALQVEGVVRWEDETSGVSAENPFSFEPACQPDAPERFTIPASESFVPDGVSLTVWFERVVLNNGEIWTGSASALREFPDTPRLSGRMANALCAAAGKDAVCCAWENDSGEWQCVCGRWNISGAENCVCCGRDCTDVLELFNPEAVEQLAPVQGPLNIEASIGEMTQDEPAPEKGVRMKRILAAVFAAALFAFFALGVRALRYETYGSSGLMPTSRAVEQRDV